MFRCPSDPSPGGSSGFGPPSTTPSLDAAAAAVGNYAGNYLALGEPSGPAFNPVGEARIPASFPDGTSNTVLYGERYAWCGTPPAGQNWASLWAYPDAAGDSSYDFRPYLCKGASYATPCVLFQPAPKWQSECLIGLDQAPHVGGMNTCLADGSVRAVNDRVSATAWQRACDPRDGLAMPNDW